MTLTSSSEYGLTGFARLPHKLTGRCASVTRQRTTSSQGWMNRLLQRTAHAETTVCVQSFQRRTGLSTTSEQLSPPYWASETRRRCRNSYYGCLTTLVTTSTS